jgi:hypothetical protein
MVLRKDMTLADLSLLPGERGERGTNQLFFADKSYHALHPAPLTTDRYMDYAIPTTKILVQTILDVAP